MSVNLNYLKLTLLKRFDQNYPNRIAHIIAKLVGDIDLNFWALKGPLKAA